MTQSPSLLLRGMVGSMMPVPYPTVKGRWRFAMARICSWKVKAGQALRFVDNFPVR